MRAPIHSATDAGPHHGVDRAEGSRRGQGRSPCSRGRSARRPIAPVRALAPADGAGRGWCAAGPTAIARVLAVLRRLETRRGGLGVGVAVEGHHLVAEEVFDEASERPDAV